MIHEAFAQGATIEEALQNAKDALHAPADADVNVELVTRPQKGVLGLFGKKKAEARAYYETPDAPQKKPDRPKEQPKAQQANSQKPQQPNPAQKKERQPQQKKEQPKPQPQAAEEAPEEVVRTEFEIDSKPGVKAGADYLLSIVRQMGVEPASVKAYLLADNEVLLDLKCGDDHGILIGRHGETLDAIQYLTRLVANKHKKEGEYARISINIGKYREKRQSTLENLAKKHAEKVLKYGRNFSFEPMSPYDRRIIHTTVQRIEGVVSESVGSDDDRHVVIMLAKGVKPTHPSKGGAPNRGGRNGRGRGPRGGGNRGGAGTVTSPTRAPKTDAGAEGVSLYGKLN